MTMDVGGYGQKLRMLGDAGLASMADLEADRARQKMLQDIENAKAQGAGYGQLAGLVLGAAKGGYGAWKKYDKKQTMQDETAGWVEAQRQARHPGSSPPVEADPFTDFMDAARSWFFFTEQ